MKLHLPVLAIILTLAFPSCTKETWKPGKPLAKENVTVGVIYITDPFTENFGYSYAHHLGIAEMKQSLGLADNQLLYKTDIDFINPPVIEAAMRELIDGGANIIFATSRDYMDSCEKLSREFPSVVFAHFAGDKHNNTNFTTYSGSTHQPKYLSGIVAGLLTKTGKIGYVAPWGEENSEVTGALNAFALGVETVNPDAGIYVRVTGSRFDLEGEITATRILIAEECDVIGQAVASPVPQIEAERAGVLGIGYSTDMSAHAPEAVFTSVLHNWGVYYTALVQSVIDGTFTTAPYLGSLTDGMVGLSPLNENIGYVREINVPAINHILIEEHLRVESGELNLLGTDETIRYYRNVVVVND
jgi:basic membrane protein A